MTAGLQPRTPTGSTTATNRSHSAAPPALSRARPTFWAAKHIGANHDAIEARSEVWLSPPAARLRLDPGRAVCDARKNRMESSTTRASVGRWAASKYPICPPRRCAKPRSESVNRQPRSPSPAHYHQPAFAKAHGFAASRSALGFQPRKASSRKPPTKQHPRQSRRPSDSKHPIPAYRRAVLRQAHCPDQRHRLPKRNEPVLGNAMCR